jgi:hypothetical protein
MTHCVRGLDNAKEIREMSARTISTRGDQSKVLRSRCGGVVQATAPLAARNRWGGEPCNARRGVLYEQVRVFEILEDENVRGLAGTAWEEAK